ncbi:MAG: hypothetical protein LBD79_03275 [Treponema sp.]|jgi:L-cysteine desulfidase|nr:hypothetical protein [Treponema sp.]
MIQGVTATVPSIGYAITASRNNNEKMSLPVSHANYIYSHFRHVYGRLAPEGVRGVPINKMKMLDVLIERLAQLKKNGDIGVTSVSDGQIDALIDQYEQQIQRTAQNAAIATVPYQTISVTQPGMLFSFMV